MKTNTPKDCVLKKRARERKETKETKNTESIWKKKFKSIKNVFKLSKENEAIKGRIIRDIGSLFEQEDDYYKLIRVAISGTTIILSMEVTAIKIKFNQ